MNIELYFDWNGSELETFFTWNGSKLKYYKLSRMIGFGGLSLWKLWCFCC